ncbi:Mitochondrial outer membrane protein iml2, partial [Ascosphaera atra]
GSGSDGEEGIYRPDTIYLLCQSMAQLMSALIGVLNETLKESAIAFYKLNRAYGNLERIMQMEEKVVRERRAKVRGGSGSGKKGGSTVGASAATSRTSLQNGEGTTFKKPSPTDDLASSMSTASLNNNSTDDGVRSSTDTRLKIDPDSDLFKNVVDVFVHSGANLCFGALMLFLSMVPPTFATLLSIVGFRGDRERGLHMLWQASRFDNLLGAIGGLALLGFYNGFVRVTDVIPDLSGNAERDVSTYPVGRLHALLEEMCTRFPKSQLWLLEKSRMQAYDKRLDRALEMLNTGEVSPLKQVEALHTFELSLDAMFAHEYALCAESFIKPSTSTSPPPATSSSTAKPPPQPPATPTPPKPRTSSSKSTSTSARRSSSPPSSPLTGTSSAR